MGEESGMDGRVVVPGRRPIQTGEPGVLLVVDLTPISGTDSLLLLGCPF